MQCTSRSRKRNLEYSNKLTDPSLYSNLAISPEPNHPYEFETFARADTFMNQFTIKCMHPHITTSILDNHIHLNTDITQAKSSLIHKC